jgi:hypothetical protein
VAQVVAASSAALAAGEGWFTASINARNFRRSIEPVLVAQALSVDGSQVHLDVHNAGGGLALTCAYYVVVA